MSINPRRGAGTLQGLAFSKCYNVQKWQSKFTLWPTDRNIENFFVSIFIDIVFFI